MKSREERDRMSRPMRHRTVDLDVGVARIRRSFSNGQHLRPTKTGRERSVELSTRLQAELGTRRPDLFGSEDLVFPNETGGLIDPHNFRDRVFRRVAEKALGKGRRFTPHGLRHTFASLHLARGSNLKWVQAQGGWASAKVLLDWYGHFLPTESSGYADALSSVSERLYPAPAERRPSAVRTAPPKMLRVSPSSVAPREGIEPPTRCLEGSCSIRLSYRGVPARLAAPRTRGFDTPPARG